MTEAHTARGHATLAPSSASRWIACPGSIRASEGIEKRSSIFADEGTGAHTLAEVCLQRGTHADTFRGGFIDIRAPREKCIATGPGEGRFPIDDEMVEGVQLYLDFCEELFAKCDWSGIEQRLSMEHVHAGIYGTGDAVGYQEATAHAHIADLKYGRGVAVEAKNNAQALCYSVGVVRLLEDKGFLVKKITMYIAQPRARHTDGPIRSWSVTREELTAFEGKLRAAAINTRAKTAKLCAGDHCRFCPASPTCPERAKVSLEQANCEFGVVDGLPAIITPALLSFGSAKLGNMLITIDQVESWCKRVREYAYDEAVHGRPPEGWKLVAKRANRKWKDENEVMKGLMALGVTGGSMYKPKELISPAEADRLVGKKGAIELKPLSEKISSGSTLAVVSDPRPSVGTDAKLEFLS